MQGKDTLPQPVGLSPNFLRTVRGDAERVMSADLPWSALSGARIVITGAAGFLGGGLVRALLALHPAGRVERPLEVVALVRDPHRARQRLADVADDPQLQWLAWDLNHIAVPALGQPSHVIHAASQASPRFYAHDPIGTLMPNTVGTAALLQASQGAERFLFVSSSEVYGAASTADALQETHFGALDPATVRACYAESKRMGETLCVAWHAQHALPTVIVRPFHTYGPGLQADDGRVFADFAYAIARNEPIVMTSDGSARRAFCYGSDAITGTLTALLRGAPAQAYNLANPQAEVSVRELAETLVAQFAHRGARLERREPPGGYLPSPFNRLVPDIGRLQALGWTPRIGIAEGFDRFIEAITP